MANPTGSTYLQADNSYLWTDGDAYEIPQADQQEGAADDASFGGLGVDKQPHQILLNKVQLVHKNQLVDETNIAGLQIFKALFASKVGINGYLKLGAQDVNLGQLDMIVQWGTISVIGLRGGGLHSDLANAAFSFNFPIAFPHAVWALLPYWQSNNPSGVGALGSAALGLEAITPLGLMSNQIFSD